MTQHIGFIGLGIMGKAMAANILNHGYPLIVHNRTADKTEALHRAGAAVAASPAQLADVADVIILMLTGPEAVNAVLHAPDGILAGDCRGTTIINMSTVPPAASRAWAEELAGHGITLLDAPVSGSRAPAEQGTLVILAGGPGEVVKQYETLLMSMGKQVIYCGPTGSGNSLKLAINLLLATMMQGLSEAVHLAERSGLTAQTLLDAVAAGPLNCGLFQLKRDMLISGDYPAQFPFRHMAKDLQFTVQTAAEQGAQLPLGNELARLFSPQADAALLDRDFAAVKTLLD